MDSSLHEVWTAAQGHPFVPAIGKDSQFYVGFGLLVLGLLIAGVFTLSRFLPCTNYTFVCSPKIDRSLVNLPLLGVPSSLAIA